MISARHFFDLSFQDTEPWPYFTAVLAVPTRTLAFGPSVTFLCFTQNLSTAFAASTGFL